MTGLVYGSVYAFQVVATNAFGDSVASESSASFRVTSPPDPPTSVVAVGANASAQISWQPAVSNGDPVTSYKAVAVQDSTKFCVAVAPLNGALPNACTVTGLTNGSNYSFTVVATNGTGSSSSSAASATIRPAGPPLPPTLVTAVGAISSARVSWNASAANGSSVTQYTARSIQEPTKSCSTDSTLGVPATTCVVLGLTNGSSSTFVVTATNLAGTSGLSNASASTFIGGAPDAPSAVEAVAGIGQISVTWTAPASNGRPITSYVVSSVQMPVKTCSYTVPTGVPAANSCIVTGLTNGTSYSFTVKATNALGTSTASSPSALVAPSSVPGPPTAVSAIAGDAQATVSWTKPTSAGAVITTYTVSTVQTPIKSCTSSALFTAPATSCVVTGLTNGTSYTFVVTATNAVGTSIPSAASSSVRPFVAASAPTAVTGTPSDGQVVVSWTAAQAVAQGVTSYRVTAVGSPAKTCTYTVPNSGPVLNRCTVTGLTNGTPYSFTVVALNVSSTSSDSFASTPVTPVGVPGTPTPVEVVVGNGSATVSWTKPADNGSVITSYTVTTVGLPTKSCTSSLPVGDPLTSCTVSGLPGGVTYSFRVSASNAVGPSTLSAPTTAVLVNDVPSPPTGLTVEVETGVGVATWNPSIANGSRVLSYQVSSVSHPELSCTYTVPVAGLSANSCRIEGLVRGQVYSFSTVAVSALGTSSVSAATDPMTVPPAMAPNNLTGISALNSRVELKWDPIVAPAGVTIKGYVVTSDPYVAPPRNCVGTPNPSCRYIGLTNGVTYNFSVRAITDLGPGSTGQATGTPGPEVPNAPTNVVVLRSQSLFAFVRWTEPLNGGAPIYAYRVTSPQDPSWSCVAVIPTDGSPWTNECNNVDDSDHWLAPDRAYTFQVSAINSVGSGPLSAPTEMPTAPAKPTNVRAVKGLSVIEITWDSPPDTGSAPLYEAYVASQPELRCEPTYADGCQLVGATSGVLYSDIVVVATNEVGTSEVSEPAPPVMPADVPPPPTLLTAVPGDGKVTVTWDGVDDLGQGEAITEYVAYAFTGFEWDPTINGSCTSTPQGRTCAITGLPNGQAQMIAVATRTESGWESERSSSVTVVPQGPPGAAGSLYLSQSGVLGTQNITVQWTRPAAYPGINSAIARVFAKVSGQAPQEVCSVSANTRTYQYCRFDTSVLPLRQEASFEVVYENSYGESRTLVTGAGSRPGGTIFRVEAPDPVSDVAITTSGSSARVTWAAPDGNGETVTSVSVTPLDSSTPVCAFTRDEQGNLPQECVVEGLVLGVPITFLVIAGNAGGTSPAAPTQTITPATIPAAPFNVVTTTTATQRMIRWTAPQTNGSRISQYTVRAVEDGNLSCSTTSLIGAPETSCIIDSVDPERQLNFVVIATNSIGSSVESFAASRINWTAVPDSPTDVRYTDGWVSWLAPESNDSETFYLRNGATISLYRVSSVEYPNETYCTYSVILGSELPTSCDVTGLTVNSSYHFTVIATNAIGSSSPSLPSAEVVASLPSRVMGLSVVPDAASVTLTWSVPSSASVHSVSSYRVFMSSYLFGGYGNGIKIPVCDVDATTVLDGTFSCVVSTFLYQGRTSGLYRGVDYGFSVESLNRFGWSTGALAVETTIPSEPIISYVPDQARNVVAVALDRGAMVTWEIPFDHDGQAQYTRTVSAVEDPSKSCANSSGRICWIYGLEIDRTYTFVVNASNATGSALTSPPSNPIRPFSVPDAPTGVVAKPMGWNSQAWDVSMLVDWVAPNSNGDEILDYTVMIDGIQQVTCAPIAPSCLIPHVMYGYSHSFAVAARNVHGRGPFSTASVPVLGAWVPEAPRLVWGQLSGSGQSPAALVSWTDSFTDGGDRGSAIIRHRASVVGNSELFCTSTGSSCSITGLASGVAYQFKVVAVNAIGESADSGASSALDLFYAPAAPSGVVAVAGDASASVTWLTPASNGSAISSYTVSVVDRPGKNCAFSVPVGEAILNSCTIAGLVNGTGYSFTVSATNAIGTSIDSAPSVAVTPGSIASAPLSVAATPGAQRASISWTRPEDDGGSPISRYVASVVGDPSKFCEVFVTPSARGTERCDIAGLENGSRYNFEIAAFNDLGRGDFGVTSDVSVSPSFSAGTSPKALSNDGSQIWIANPDSNSVTVLNARTGSLVRSTTWGINAWTSGPVKPAAIASDGHRVWVAPSNDVYASGGNVNVYGSYGTTYGAFITELDASDGSVLRKIVVPSGPESITTDEKSVWVTGYYGQKLVGSDYVDSMVWWENPERLEYFVTQIDQNTGAVLRKISVGASQRFDAVPATTKVTSDGTYVWVTNSTLGTLTQIRISDGTVLRTVNLRGLAAGIRPSAVASDSINVWVADANGDDVLQFEVSTGLLVRTISVGDTPSGLALTGSFVWVTNSGDSSVSLLSKASGAVVATTTTESGPKSISANGETVWMTSAGSNSAIRLTAGVVPSDLPSAPAIGEIVVGDRSAIINWSASTANGSALQSYTASVVGDESKHCEVSVLASLVTACEISGLSNGTVYAFKVQARNGNGPSPWSEDSRQIVPVGLPSAPTGVSVQGGDHKVVVQWQPSDPNGTQVLDYTARIVGQATSNCVVVPTGSTELGCEIAGLLNGVANRVEVVARNALGQSAASLPSSLVTSSGLPEQPTGVTAVAGDRQATVSWRPASGNGSAITSFTARVVATPSTSCSWVVDETAAYSCSIRGLVNGTSISVEVVATNLNGESSASAGVEVQPYGLPGAPTAVIAIEGENSAQVSWTPTEEQSTAVVSYTVKAVEDPLRSCTYRARISVGNRCIVTGLTNGRSYSFVVVAANSVQGGSDSVPSNSVVPRGPPLAPTNPVVARRSNTHYLVRWEAPSDNGSPITSYTVINQGDRSITCTVLVSVARQCEFIIDSIYTQDFVVTATNMVGTGDESRPTAQGAFTPDRPSNVRAQAGDGKALVTWDNGVANGSRVTGYSVSVRGFPTLGCTIDSNLEWYYWSTPCMVEGLTNGVSYSFEVTATNGIGTSDPSDPSSSVTPWALPGAPTGVAAAGFDGDVTITWTAAASEAPISSYTARQVIESPFDAWPWDPRSIPRTCTSTSVGGSAPETSCVIRGLSVGTSYRFQVAATNSVGTGTQSAPTEFFLVSRFPREVPSAPSSVQVVGGDGQVAISWSTPYDSGTPITSYVASVVSDASKSCQVVVSESSVNLCVISGLTNGKTISVGVTAQNEFGDSPVGYSSSVTPATRPKVIESISGVPGANSVVVSWTPVADSSAVVTSYLVSSVEDSSRTCTYVVGSSVGNSCSVTGLTNGSSYSFVVTASNTNEAGPASVASNPVVPRAPPSAPTNVVALPSGTDFTVRWGVPADNGSPITSYTVYSQNSSQTCTVVVPVGGLADSDRSCLFHMFSSQGMYFTVVATNAGGTSPESALSSYSQNVPSAPINVSAQALDGKAVVSWPKALSNGATINRYNVTAVGDNSVGCSPAITNAWNESTYSCVVTGLTNLVPYSFVVTATNGMGSSSPSAATTPVTPMALPGVPTNVIVVGANTSAIVSWTAPASTAPILSYVVTEVLPPEFLWRGDIPHSCSTVSAEGTSLGTSCTVTGLTNGKSYSFTAAATTGGGMGISSAASARTVVAGVPNAPSISSALYSSAFGQVLIQFTKPAENGSPIRSITVRAVEDPTKECSADQVTFTWCRISGLSVGQSYTFVAVATNGIGPSPDSLPSAPVIVSAVPGAPSTMTATPGDRSISVVWTDASANGSSILSYTAKAVEPGSPYYSYNASQRRWVLVFSEAQCVVTVTSGSANSCMIPGLKNGTEYQVTVVATNAVGEGSATAMSATPKSVPGPVTASVVSGDSSVDVSWAGTASNGSAITSYVATATSAEGGPRTCSYVVDLTVAVASSNRCTIRGLTNGAEYSVSVVATNGVGTGSPGPVLPVTPASVPSAPTGVVATPTSGANIEVAWATPNSNGGAPITSYTVRAREASPEGHYYGIAPPVLTCTATVPVSGVQPTSCLVLGLRASWPYLFTVSASSSAGSSAESVVSAPATPVRPPTVSEFRVTAAPNASVSVWMGYNIVEEGILSRTTSLVGTSISCTVVFGGCTLTDLPTGVPLTFVQTAVNPAGSATSSSVVLTLVPPPTAPDTATAILGSDWARVVFSTPSEGTQNIVASVVGDPSKSCTYVVGYNEGNRCVISGLSSPLTAQFQVVATNYWTGSSGPKVTTKYSGPIVTSVSGMTSSESAIPAGSASVSSRPILRGSAMVPGVDGAASTVLISLSPSSPQSWMDNVVEVNLKTGRWLRIPSASATSHTFIAPVAADGSWSQALPTDFPDGTFNVAVSQNTGWGSIGNSSNPSAVVLSTPTTVDSLVLHGTGSSMVLTVSGSVPADRAITALSVSVPGTTVAPCTAVVSGSSWTCGLTGVTPSGSTRIEVATTTRIWSQWCRNYNGNCVEWRDLNDALHTQTSSVSVIRDLTSATSSASITSPTSVTLGADRLPVASSMHLVTGFTVSGTMSLTEPATAVVTAFAGVGVNGAALNPVRVLSSSGTFSTPVRLPDGVWTLDVARIDSSGVASAGAPVTVVVNSTPPTVSVAWPQAAATVPAGFVGGTVTGGWGIGASSPATTATVVIDYFEGAEVTGTPRMTKTLTTCAECGGQFSDAPVLANGVWTARLTAAARTGLTTIRTVTFTVNSASSAGQSPQLTLLDADGAALSSSSRPIAGTSFFSVRVGSTTGQFNGPRGTGSVTLLDGTTVLGTSEVIDGVAQFQTELGVGPTAHQISARYSGNSWYLPTTSPTIALTMTGARPSATVTPVFPDGLGQPGSFRVTLSYSGQRGTTQYCDSPTIKIQAQSFHYNPNGYFSNGVFLRYSTDHKFNWYVKTSSPVASGRLEVPSIDGRPSGGGSLPAINTSGFDEYESEYEFWISSAGDSRCAAFDGSKFGEVSLYPEYPPFAPYAFRWATPETTPIFSLAAMPFRKYVAKVRPVAEIQREASLGSTSTYNVGSATSVAVDVQGAMVGLNNEPRWAMTFRDMRFAAPEVGAPVWALDDAGNTVGAAVLTDSAGRAILSWTPTQSGWVTRKYLVGEFAPGGVFTGTVVSMTVPVEAAPINMVVTQSVAPFVIGAAVNSLVSLGSAGLSGSLWYRDHALATGPDANVWQSAPLHCIGVCQSTVPMPKSLRLGPSANIDYKFISTATGLTYQSTTPVARMSPQPLAVSIVHTQTAEEKATDGNKGLTVGQATRDKLTDITVTLKNSVPDQWYGVSDDRKAAGTLLIAARPECSGETYCTDKATEIRYDLAIVGGAPVVVHSPGAAWVPTSAVAVEVNGANWTLTIATKIFIGGMRFTVSAAYTPPTSNYYAVTASSQSIAVTGIGPPPIILSQGSATMTGGRCKPQIVTWRTTLGACTATDVSPMLPIASATAPRPGQTLYIKAECDPVLCTSNDRLAKYDLAISQNGAAGAKFVSDPSLENPYKPQSILAAGGVPTDTVRPTILGDTDTYIYSADEYACRFAYELVGRMTHRGVCSPYTCDRCVIWPISSVSTDPAEAVALMPTAIFFGLVQYQPTASGQYISGTPEELAARANRILTFPVVVQPEPTQAASKASAHFTRSNQWSGLGTWQVDVLTAARWPSIAPTVPTSDVAVQAHVFLTIGGVEQEIALCFYDGFCAKTGLLPKDVALPTVRTNTVNGQLAIQVDLPGTAGFDKLNGATVRVETESTWGTADVGDEIPLTLTETIAPSEDEVRPSASDFYTTTQASEVLRISAEGEWKGALLTTPDLSSPSAFGWEFYHEVNSFYRYFFSDHLADVLTRITEQVIIFIAESAISAIAMNALGVAALAARMGAAVYKIVKTVKAVRAMIYSYKTALIAGRVSRLMRGSVAIGRFAYTKLVEHCRDSLVQMPIDYLTSVIDSGGFNKPVFDDFFTSSPRLQLAIDITNNDIDNNRDIPAQQYKYYFDQIMAQRKAAADGAPATTDDVGFGYGVSTQFVQFFTASIAIKVPWGYYSSHPENSYVDVHLMSQARGNIGPLGPDSNYRQLEKGVLAHCTLAGVCDINESFTAVLANGRIILSGNFPQDVAWAPPGAWIEATLTHWSGESATAWADIGFPGEQVNCSRSRYWRTCADYEYAMRDGAKLTWSETTNPNYPKPGSLPWISVNPPPFNPKAGYPDQKFFRSRLPAW